MLTVVGHALTQGSRAGASSRISHERQTRLRERETRLPTNGKRPANWRGTLHGAGHRRQRCSNLLCCGRGIGFLGGGYTLAHCRCTPGSLTVDPLGIELGRTSEAFRRAIGGRRWAFLGRYGSLLHGIDRGRCIGLGHCSWYNRYSGRRSSRCRSSWRLSRSWRLSQSNAR